MRIYDNALHIMEEQGGSFVKALAHLYYCADAENKHKARVAFAKYFDAYEQRFQEHLARRKADKEGGAA